MNPVKAPRTLFVTGAGRDIGAGIALASAAPGDFVLLHTHADPAAANAVLGKLRAGGAEGVVLSADFSQPAAVARLADAVLAALAGRPLDVLVHNAAIAVPTPLSAADLTGVEQLFTVNTFAPQLLMQKLCGALADGAAVLALTITSNAVFSPDFSGFTASKLALESLVKHWAAALGQRSIRVNALAPGVTEANFRAEMLKDDAFRAGLIASNTLPRVGQIDDVVDAAVYLLSPAARWVTGQTLTVNGGWRL